jgi:hypothetical protein
MAVVSRRGSSPIKSSISSGRSSEAAHSALLVDRQLQGLHQRPHLLPGGQVRQARFLPQRGLVEVVERGEAERKELAKHHALGKTLGRAEAEAQAEPVEAFADQLLVARAEQREPVAHHDPVGQPAVDDAPLAPRVPHHLGVVARAGDLEGRGIDIAQHVEVEKAVVQRRHQRVGHRVRETHQVGVVPRRVHHDEIMGVLDRVDRARETAELGGLVLVDPDAFRARDRVVLRHLERETGAPDVVAAVLDVAGEGLLPAVEVDRRHALPGLEQRDRDVHRAGGFARATLLVAEHDHVRGTWNAAHCLEQHYSTPRRSIIRTHLPQGQ